METNEVLGSDDQRVALDSHTHIHTTHTGKVFGVLPDAFFHARLFFPFILPLFVIT